MKGEECMGCDEKGWKLSQFERNKFFYGKLMRASDFKAEQEFFIGKQRLINRLIHGSGVVCGLQVEAINETIKLNPGVAIDCWGREIIVPETADIINTNDLYEKETLYVLLKYDCSETDKLPAISSESGSEENCVYYRLLETYKIETAKELPEGCVPSDFGLCKSWADYLNKQNTEKFDNYWKCNEYKEGPAVVIAAIRKKDENIEIDDTIKIKNEKDETEFKKNRVFSNPRLYQLIKCLNNKKPIKDPEIVEKVPEYNLEKDLTIIEESGPTDLITLEEFLQNGGDISLTFSKKVLEKTVNRDTFEVFVLKPKDHHNKDTGKHDDVIYYYQRVNGEITNQILEDGRHKFIFRPTDVSKDIISEYVEIKEGLTRGKAKEIKILVKIKCDFIHDDRKAVAGRNLMGGGKSGLNLQGYNIQGGLYEWWFYVY